MANIVFGLIGKTKDFAGYKSSRWERWRPTVGLCAQENFKVDRLELICQQGTDGLFENISNDIAQESPDTEVVHHPVRMDDPWDFEEVYTLLYDILAEQHFSPENNYYIHMTTGSHVVQIVWFLLMEAGYIPARLVQSSPWKGSPKWKGTYQIVDISLSKYDKIAARFHREKLEDTDQLKSGIATRNKAFNTLIDRIEQVAVRSTAPILLQGPTGAGKTHLARNIFEVKCNRQDIPGDFVEVNCATLRGDGAMAALFGHTRGAFTGAQQARPGLLRAAHKGVLFLDEIGELGADEQAMLLRAIEDKRFTPMGSDTPVTSDFQLIAGTNRDLQNDVIEGHFREDLLARINLWQFELPSLKERKEDIEPNIEHELLKHQQRTASLVRFNKEAWDRYLRFATSPEATWPGNFRDLVSSLTRMLTLSESSRISIDLVEEETELLMQRWRKHDHKPGDEKLEEYLSEEALESLDEFDRPQLCNVIEVCEQSKNLSAAGRTLFQASRQQKKSSNDSDRLRKYLAKFGLEWSDFN